MAREAKDPGFLIALAVHRKTSCPHECLELVRHLTSRDVQRRFGETLGNLPAREDAFFDAEALARSGLSERRLKTALNRTTLCWPEQARMDVFERLNAVDPLDVLLTKGEITVAEAVERLRFALAILSAEAHSTSTTRKNTAPPLPVAAKRR
jgi:hypothetical protein